MKLLLDTHALVWWITSDRRLSPNARSAIANSEHEILVSVASAWEIAIKVGQAKWPEARQLLEGFETTISDEGFAILPVSVAHVRDAGMMVADHRDPFDRLLVAQAKAEKASFTTADSKLRALGADCLW